MKKLAVLIVILIAAACADINHEPKPDDFYGDEKMADMLTDLYLMESSMTSNREGFTDLKMLPKDFIYKKYETDSVTFKDNIYYYADRVEKYLQLMDG